MTVQDYMINWGVFHVKQWLKKVGIRTIKTMAETAIAVIGTNVVGITEVDWIGVGSAMLLSGVVTVLFNIKSIPESEDI
jgi:hypothetical protein